MDTNPEIPQHDATTIGTLQSLIVAFVLAMTFRGFVTEGFVIPTGSMAPTLMGEHLMLHSDQTGLTYPVDSKGSNRPGAVYDPMLGKLIAYGSTREEARRRMTRALREMLVEGIRTNIAYHRWVLNSEEFIQGEIDTGLLERSFTGTPPPARKDREDAAILAAVIATHEQARRLRPTRESGGGMNPWRLLGRPGISRRGR